MVAFDASDTEQIVTTRIIDNEVLESVESFTATIVAVEGLFPVAVVMNGTVTVEIVDDDGECSPGQQPVPICVKKLWTVTITTFVGLNSVSSYNKYSHHFC